MFRVGGEVVKERSDDGVDDSNIVEAQDLVQHGRLRNRICDQTQHAQLLLETFAYLEERGAMPARSKTIKTRYERVAGSHTVELGSFRHTPMRRLRSQIRVVTSCSNASATRLEQLTQWGVMRDLWLVVSENTRHGGV